MGGFADLITGIYGSITDPTKGERNRLESLGGYDTNVGEGLTTAGAQFDENILSGDPTKQAQALAPEISAGQEMVQQNKNQNAQFAPRSGGTAASTAGAETAERGNIIKEVGGLQKGAADSALSAGGNLLSQATTNTTTEADLAHQQFLDQSNAINKTVTGAGEIATSVAGGFAGGDVPTGSSPDLGSWNELMQEGTIPDQGAGGGNAGLDLSVFQ
jgi:hypothetical protein